MGLSFCRGEKWPMRPYAQIYLQTMVAVGGGAHKPSHTHPTPSIY